MQEHALGRGSPSLLNHEVEPRNYLGPRPNGLSTATKANRSGRGRKMLSSCPWVGKRGSVSCRVAGCVGRKGSRSCTALVAHVARPLGRVRLCGHVCARARVGWWCGALHVWGIVAWCSGSA